ncbi:putative phage head-tail adaptor [Catonella morbi ATCC 51271]|uniref:Putative phage head-tail adaptor n=1 Tax=Catonella morbi ATCC 51271 TaxID=592026 RepID=V2Y1D3_9FIRM|nr:phage head-tail adaptor [Catonella morbi]ESL01506.1 putative phage head-tail adaptor [Catonella morbi ATCC 51271]
MRKLKRNIAAAMIMTMSLSMLPVQFNPTVASAAQTKKVTVKKAEITVNSNKGIKSALKNKSIKRIILNAVSAKTLSIPKGNYKDKTLFIYAAEKSKIYISKGAKFKKIIYLGAVKNTSLVLDESGSKIEIASGTALNISGKAAYAELTYKAGSESAKVTSKVDLIVENKTKKTVKLVIADKKVTVKPGERYANENLDIEDDETAQGAANVDVNEDNASGGSGTAGNTAGGNTGGGFAGGGFAGGGSSGGGGNAGNNGGNSSNNGGNTGNNGGNSSNNGGNAGNKVGTTKLVNETRTKIIDATGFLRYVVVNFEKGYTKDNTATYVDGVDITSELTPVDKEGTLVKWEVDNLNPAEVKVVSKTDSKLNQIVKLNRDADAGEVVAPVLTKEAKSPKYIIGYGKVAVWDYYLSNYDDEGKLRYKPKSTTFDLNLKATRKLTERPYYTVPAVEEGDVQVQFNYTDEADKKWFDGIQPKGALQLVSDNENQTTLNKELVYTKSFKEHNGKTVAVLTTSTQQVNFRNRGYYRIRIKSDASKAVMVRVKVEGRETPEFLLKEPSVQSGKNLHFAVKNVTVGLERPVEKAELILPTGEIKTLRLIGDYFMFNDLFVLYNDVTRGKEEDGTKGVNNIPYNGNYTLRVHFHSYKTVDTVFRVTDGKDIEKKEEKKNADNRVMTMGSRSSLLSVDGMRFDAVAGATKVGTTPGDSSSGGGNAISANIIFNTDLVANAEIFEKLGIENAYAKGIVDRFEKDMTNFIAVYDEEGKVFYDWAYYNTAVNTAKTKGKYLTFSEYVKTPNVKTTNRLTRVKEVLEDNLLGELVMDGSYLGKPMEGFTYPNGNKVKENEELVVYADKTYLSKIKVLHNQYYTTHYDGTQNGYSVKTSDYRVDNDKLIIKGSAFFRDQYLKEYNKKLTITVYADGYQPHTVEAIVSKADKKPEGPKQPEEPKKPENPGQGDKKPENGLKSLVINSDKLHMTGDNGVLTIGSGFAVENAREWLKSITGITMDGVKYTNKGELGFFGNLEDNQYGFSFEMLKIRRPNNTKKSVELVIESSIYKSYTITFNNSSPYSADIIKMEETKTANTGDNNGKQENELKSLDIPEGAELRNGKNFNEIVIKSDFGATNAEEWIKNITSVTVDGKAYEKNTTGMFGGAGTNKYGVKSGELTVGLSYNAIENRPMVIESTGFKTYTFILDTRNQYDPKLVKIVETNAASAPNKDAEDGTKNTEPAFTDLKFNSAFGVHELYINPKREDLLKASAVKMSVKGSDGSYKEIENSSFKMKEGHIQISDLKTSRYSTAIGNMLAEGDNDVRVEFDGVKEPVDIVIVRTGKYSIRLTLKK